MTESIHVVCPHYHGVNRASQIIFRTCFRLSNTIKMVVFAEVIYLGHSLTAMESEARAVSPR
jgi:hypothetical protein